MSKPTGHHNQRRQGNRRSHHALKKISLATCKKCNELVLPHTVCQACGSYDGRQVLDKNKELEKTLAKAGVKKSASKATEKTES